MPVAIVGVARSGTSMLSRILNLSGLYLGPEQDMKGVSDQNPTGHWEHRKLQDISRNVLSHLGGSIDAPPILASGWESDPSLDPFYAEARAAVEESFGGQKLWGWKDPQTTNIIPFWRKVVPDLKFVISVRNPLEVARSWDPERDKLLRPLLLALWHIGYLSIFADTTPGERIVVFYDSFFPSYREPLAPVLQFLGLPEVVIGSDADKSINSFMDRGLKHHDSTFEDLWSDLSIPPITRRFYADLLNDFSDGEIEKQLANKDEIFAFQQPKCQLLFKLRELEMRQLEYDQILNSTTHRAAAAICSVLMKIPAANAYSLRRRKKNSNVKESAGDATPRASTGTATA